MSKNYCFTSFTGIDPEEIYIQNVDILNYMAWGNEICPETGRAHKQGWLQLKKRTRHSTVCTLMGGKTALYECRGTEAQNEKYCRKDSDFKSLGEFTTQGQRTDLTRIAGEILSGAKNLRQVAEDYPGDYIRYHRGFEKMRQMHIKEQTEEFRQLDVKVYFGETGTGKTRAAKLENGFMIHGDDMQWWDGYAQEETLIIDEYNNQIPITKLLGLLDGYQLRLPIKGGFTYANWTKVILTTNLSELHPNAKDVHINALQRRINEYIEFPLDCTEVRVILPLTSTQRSHSDTID